MAAYDIRTVIDRGELASLRSEWNRVVEQDSSATLFQRWEWNDAWWEWMGRHTSRLCILVVAEALGREPIGIAPFCITERRSPFGKIRVLELLGGRYLDYQNVIVGDEHKEGVIDLIAGWLTRREVKWDVADFRHIILDSPPEGCLLRALQGIPFPVEIRQDVKSPYLSLHPGRPLL